VLLFLLGGVVIPSAAIFWLTNRTADREAEAARREVVEANQGQLRLMRDRVDAAWKHRVEQLAAANSFQAVVSGNLADSAIMLRPDGSFAHPVPMRPFSPPTEDAAWAVARGFEVAKNWTGAADIYSRMTQTAIDPGAAARAAQAEVRCLIQAGQITKAVNRIEQYFVNGKGANAVDSQGRSISADELLLAVKVLPPSDSRRQQFLARLERVLNGYDETHMPSAQRLFLMSEAQAAGAGAFPTFEGERLAAQYLESDPPRAVGTGLVATNTPGLWKLLAANGRMVALFRTQSVEAVTRTAIGDAGNLDRFRAIPPGQPSEAASVSAGAMLPGWQLAFTTAHSASVDAESIRRRNLYLWTGYLGIAALVITGLLFGRVFRRHIQLARLKTDLVATVSHELKTPLASMRLLVDALLEEDDFDPVRTREYLTLIAGENQRLTGLVENFLTFSRIERRKLPFEFRSASPEAVVHSAAAAMRGRFEQSGGSMTVDVEPGLPVFRADPDALTTVLINLLDNAFKYSPDEKRVTICARRNAGRVIFAVADSGVGISTTDQRRIFREFYRVDQSMASDTMGCGLGLHIVEYIVKAHGGEVRVSSAPGKGSTFTILIPEAA
jgi:signal transduction histidine kinase